ncbi:MAG: ECF transporter S component, partial [Acidimicrobiales bacterium]
GYVFGVEFGFLLGAMSLLVSALVTGGLGPWVPYELCGVGWVGALAGLAGTGRRGRPGWRDLALLAAVGVVTGYAYGALTDLWQWTFYSGSPGLGFRPGMGLGTALDHFGRFYVATSVGWDSFRAWGDALVVVAIGLPVIAGLRRLRGQQRFELVVAPGGQSALEGRP